MEENTNIAGIHASALRCVVSPQVNIMLFLILIKV